MQAGSAALTPAERVVRGGCTKDGGLDLGIVGFSQVLPFVGPSPCALSPQAQAAASECGDLVLQTKWQL